MQSLKLLKTFQIPSLNLMQNKLKKFSGLEFIRGFAALMVMAGHFFLNLNDLEDLRGNYLTSFLVNWGRESVLLFFILSGVVVHYSFYRKNRTSLQFIKERIIRLHPTLIINVLICIVIEFYFFKGMPSLNMIIGNFIPYSTMPGYLAPLFWNTNAAIWSLTFEVFFYFVFGLIIIRNKAISDRNLFIWLFISLLSIYYYFNPLSNKLINHFVMMLSFSPVWIIGFLIYKYKDFVYTNTKLALLSVSILPLVSRIHIFSDSYYNPIMFILFSLASVPLFVLLMNSSNIRAEHNKVYSYISLSFIYILGILFLVFDPNYTKTSKVLYCVLPILTILVVNVTLVFKVITAFVKQTIIPFFGYFGKYSYSIYLFHTPFIKLSNFFNIPLMIKVILIITATFSVSYAIERYLQPYLNKKLI
ncbi:Acyltransferase family protein [compost metagenome]